MPAAVAAPYAGTPEQVLQRHGVDAAAGLDAAEAGRRLRGHGPNRLREARTRNT